MKLCHFGPGRLGLVDGKVVKDVSAALDVLPAQRWPYSSGDPLIEHLDLLRPRVTQVAPQSKEYLIDDVDLYSPITSPSKVMAVPANYRKHVEIDVMTDKGVDQGVHAKQLQGVDRPVETYGVFLKANSSIHGASQGIVRALPDRRTDHEAELCVVIGRECRSASRKDAMSYVAGYLMGLDMTVRGAEDRSYRKSADGYTVLGPYFVTADEVEDPTKIDIWLNVNGAPRQNSSVGAMTVDIPDLIAFASAFYTLKPGDIIMTGTPEGVGPVESGDVITVGGSGLGSMDVKIS
ncbi:2-hydroxyhepta-2,4-diene-1,7-dioate isomerase [Sulfitobacter sp. EhC04]|uniref:fumarylacetoacetate hydrolase family protein n=1 Tax=Sulfitobacter sp. EhC04 TaxID=1849168 RepID=UPI0007F4449B|nr:fumarylacetoacetate hydrolase family protein [Sulfitobacter sp. EhC04]OAN75721.1 2-hydroxyhepta-2,4-diene-1,7-dioate isomerase [Sulfitobacter sp. EhC04]